MRLMTNEELEAVGGGDQTYEHVEKRMTEDEKRDYDKRAIWEANGYGGGV